MGKAEREKGKAGVVWKDIIGYEGLYQVSNLGEVRSLPRYTTRGKVLSLYTSAQNGYVYANLCKNNIKSTKRVHKLVMMAFCGVDSARPDINHKNGRKTDNRLVNLEWCSQRDNQIHAYALGLQPPSGIKVVCLDNLKVYLNLTKAAIDAGGKFGEMVARVCRGERSHYRGMHYAFLDDYENGTIPKFTGRSIKKASKSLWR